MPLLPPPPDPILTQVDAARKAVDDQFSALAKSLKTQAAKSRRDLTGQLSQGFRRLRTFENERNWIDAVLDASAPFCFRAVFFTVSNGALEWKSARNVEVKPGIKLSLDQAPAFAAAVSSTEITVALKTTGELSKILTNSLGEEPQERVALAPISANGRVMAILYGEDADTAGLELIAIMAGSTLEFHQRNRKASDTGLLQIAPAAASPGLTLEEESLDLRAQRFARVRVSEMRLFETANVQSGRVNKNIYQALQPRIDEAREAYRNQFAAESSFMVDHLDLELVRTLAEGDRELMGPDYPGPLL